jgi:hypothetical protein
VNDAIKPLPKRRGPDSAAGNDLADDEIMEDFGNLQAGNGYALDFRHPNISSVCIGPKGYAPIGAAKLSDQWWIHVRRHALRGASAGGFRYLVPKVIQGDQ